MNFAFKQPCNVKRFDYHFLSDCSDDLTFFMARPHFAPLVSLVSGQPSEMRLEKVFVHLVQHWSQWGALTTKNDESINKPNC